MSGTTPAWMGKWAHDLREPLSPMQSALYLLRYGESEGAERDELFDLIDRQIRRLVSMIDEVNDWVRADQGRLLHIRGPVELQLLIEGCLSAAGASAVDIGVEYRDGADRARINGDASRLASLFSTMLWLMSSPSPDVGAKAGVAPARAVVSLDREAGSILFEGPLLRASGIRGSIANLFAEPQPASMGDGLGLRAVIALAIAQGHGGELVLLEDASDTPMLRLSLPLLDEEAE